MTIHTKLSKRLINPTIIIPSIFLFLTVISALTLTKSPSSTKVSATEDRKSALASVTVPDTCYMSSTSTTHTGTASGGTYTENFGGESTVTVTCNDRNGYSVYAVGYSNDIEGTNGLIGTSTGLIIPSGTSTSTNVSNWAMKLTPVAGTYAPTILSDTNGSFANYHIVPTTTTKVATLTSDINVSNSSQFKTSYAVAVAPSQAADTYIGKVKYTVVHPNYSNADGTLESYPITLGFGANTSSIVIDGVTYTSTSATPNLTYGTHTISGTYPSGYEFSSWAASGSVSVASTSSASTTLTVTGTGTLTLTGKASPITLTINFGTGIYGVMVKSGSLTGDSMGLVTTSGGTVDLTSTSTNYYLIPLYKKQYTFNNWTASGGTVTSDTTNSYGYYYYRAQTGATNTATISAKSLGTTSSTTMQNLSASSCTHAPSAVKDSRDNEVYYIQRLADGKCWMLENLRLASGTLTSSNSNVSSSFTLPTSGTTCFATTANCDSSGNSTHTGYTVAAINTSYKTTTKTGYGPGRNYVGVYYNYCAASAGTICAKSNSSNASYDVCLAGWKMPAGGSGSGVGNAAGGYYYLYDTSYKANQEAFRYALSTPLSGYFGSGSAYGQGAHGGFWSATKYSSSGMYVLYTYSSDVSPTGTNNRYFGSSVRCILK